MQEYAGKERYEQVIFGMYSNVRFNGVLLGSNGYGMNTMPILQSCSQYLKSWKLPEYGGAV